MNRLRVSVVGTMLFLVVAVTCVLMTSHKSAAQRPPDTGPGVNILSPLPLPVTGTLSFAAGSTVTVNNPAGSPVLVRDVDHGTPFQKFASVHGNDLYFEPVPAGQRWIVEHVSAEAEAEPPVEAGFAVVEFRLISNVGIGPVVDVLIPQKTAFDTVLTTALTNSQTKVIVDPGQKLELVAIWWGWRHCLVSLRLWRHCSGTIVVRKNGGPWNLTAKRPPSL